jgi:hypothetical protein
VDLVKMQEKQLARVVMVVLMVLLKKTSWDLTQFMYKRSGGIKNQLLADQKFKDLPVPLQE